jgi:hypothetical protein
MNLLEIYKEVLLKNFFNQIQEELPLNEALDPKLQSLLNEAKELVFDKFGIDPKDKVYFIAGSAALYLYPQLRDALNLKGSIGDLDIVIPDRKYWEKAGLGDQTIYRPKNNNTIEAFDVWDPAKAGGEYVDTKVRETNQILNDAFSAGGYWFMSLKDVLDYKSKLSREKEQEILNLLTQYKNNPSSELKRRILSFYPKKALK